MATLPYQTQLSINTNYQATPRHRLAAALILFYEARLQDADKIDISANELLRTSGQFYLESFDVQMADNERRTVTASMIEVFDL